MSLASLLRTSELSASAFFPFGLPLPDKVAALDARFASAIARGVATNALVLSRRIDLEATKKVLS